MASFVTEVLTSAGHLETQEASSKLHQLTKQIDSLKLQVYDVTVNKYSDYIPKLHSTNQLVQDVESVKSEMDDVSTRIENQIKSQLNKSTGEFQSLTVQLDDVTCLLTVLERLVSLQDGLEALEIAVRNQDYGKAADSVAMMKTLLEQKVYKHEDEIKILSSIKTETENKLTVLICELSDKWKEMIQWTVPADKDIKNEESRKTELRLHIKAENAKGLKKVITGLKKMEILEEKMKKFSQRLLSHILEPLTVLGGCEVLVSETPQAKVLTVTVPADAQLSAPTPQDMFGRLDCVLQFLNENLLNVEVGQSEGSDKKPLTLMSMLGSMVADKTLHGAVKECLIRAIPSSNKEMGDFNNVILLTEQVHHHLIKTNFIQPDNTVLLDYIQNVNVLFANKKCQDILERARLQMTTEVHNTTEVSYDKPLGELPPLIEGAGAAKRAKRDALPVESPISANTFRLPKCKISTSIQELMKMAYETLSEAGQSSPQCAIQMFCAVRNMFELFCSVFPTYHKQSLETLPQFTALHYNNCMFIAHHLMVLGHQFSQKLPSSINATFVDLVPKIRRLGTDSFLQQLQKQKAQMSEYLEAANGFLTVSEKETFFASERAVKQVIHQLQHLKKVWQEVLPTSNYRKAVGCLLNGVIIEMTDSIVCLEDISADDAKQLSRLLNMLSDRAPELFQTDADDKTNVTVEIQRSVAKWPRFKELDLMLNASMIDISDRWAAGKGPLAVAFSAKEVKQMIRALFQNTDRRAAMLAKIK